VLHSGRWWSVEGTQGAAFEREFAEFQGARRGIACTNGTAALEVALRALGVGCGDEVIVPPYTFVATASAVLQVGAAPVFVDIDATTLNIDPMQIAAAITPRTRALIPVHIAGRPADMDAILEIARTHDLRVIEDAAQAHGAAWRGHPVGALGDCGTFSFQASKNLNGGEGGLVVTDNEALAEAVWSVVNVGRTRDGRWYEHEVLGGNFRITEFQSAVLRVQLSRLPEQMALRTENAAILTALLAQIEGVLLPPHDPRITTHAHHLFPVRYVAAAFGDRSLAEVVKTLNAEGVPATSGYVPLYKERLFAHVAARNASLCRQCRAIDYPALTLPACEQVCADCLWLPQTLLLGKPADMEDVATAVEKVRRAFDAA
jgi:dTDP-4-amino-4,6-dideoxygalactose transaminase